MYVCLYVCMYVCMYVRTHLDSGEERIWRLGRDGGCDGFERLLLLNEHRGHASARAALTRSNWGVSVSRCARGRSMQVDAGRWRGGSGSS